LFLPQKTQTKKLFLFLNQKPKMNFITVNDVPPSQAIIVVCCIIGFILLLTKEQDQHAVLNWIIRFMEKVWSEPIFKCFFFFFAGLFVLGLSMSVLIQTTFPLDDMSKTMDKRCESIAIVGATPFVFLFKVLPQYLFYDVVVPWTQGFLVILWNSMTHLTNVVSMIMDHLSIIIQYVYLSSLIWSEWILQTFCMPVMNLLSSIISTIVNTPIKLLAKTFKAIQNILWISYLELRLLFE
jgi:hypothetical protein